jgi:Flp pilus assembly pilin Flp
MKAKAMEMKMKRIWNRLKDESGVGVVEVILILVVLITLVLLFKAELTTLLSNILAEITQKTQQVY